MMMTEKFETLKINSLRLEGEVRVTHPISRKEELLDTSYAAEYNNCFAVNNSVLAFVEDNILYVTPYTCSAERGLREEGFKRADFYVPFSAQWAFPTEQKARWEELKNWGRKQNKLECRCL